MDIHQFIIRLIQQTEDGKCGWLDVAQGYRLILRLGDIVFHVSMDAITNAFAYALVLSDISGTFASYGVDTADNYDEQLYGEMDKLRVAIEQWKNRVVLQKMQALYNEL